MASDLRLRIREMVQRIIGVVFEEVEEGIGNMVAGLQATLDDALAGNVPRNGAPKRVRHDDRFGGRTLKIGVATTPDKPRRNPNPNTAPAREALAAKREAKRIADAKRRPPKGKRKAGKRKAESKPALIERKTIAIVAGKPTMTGRIRELLMKKGPMVLDDIVPALRPEDFKVHPAETRHRVAIQLHGCAGIERVPHTDPVQWRALPSVD